MDDGAGSGNPRECGGRAAGGIHRPRADARLTLWIFSAHGAGQASGGGAVNHMLPAQLKAEAFKNYPPLARQLATDSIELFQQLPLTFVALLLRELISYDWKFPAERKDMDRQLAYLGPLAQAQRKKLMAPFASLDIN